MLSSRSRAPSSCCCGLRRYSPDFPSRFASFEDALAFLRQFFAWYNDQHRHSGIAFFTPSAVHHGQVDQLAARRNDALGDAYSRNPERFVHGPPASRLPPAAVYINPPETPIATTTTLH